MVYLVNVAFELDQKQIRRLRKLGKTWVRTEAVDMSHKTASRLIGVSVEKNRVVRSILEPTWTDDIRSALRLYRVSRVHVYKLERANPVATLSLEFFDSRLPAGSTHRLSSTQILNILKALDLADCIDISTSVYSIVGSLAPVDDAWTPHTLDGWMHIEGGYMDAKVLEQLVAQVAIERSILNYSLRDRKGLSRLFASPFSSNLIRRWPVEFLADRESITAGYHQLRKSLNIPNVRAELLERSRHWWTVFSVGVGLLATVIAAVAQVI